MLQSSVPAAVVSRTLRFAERDLEFGGPYLGEMRDANALLDDPAALRARMAEDGYLLLRGVHDPTLVLEARLQMAECLAGDGLLDPAAAPMDLVPRPENHGGFFGGEYGQMGEPVAFAAKLREVLAASS